MACPDKNISCYSTGFWSDVISYPDPIYGFEMLLRSGNETRSNVHTCAKLVLVPERSVEKQEIQDVVIPLCSLFPVLDLLQYAEGRTD